MSIKDLKNSLISKLYEWANNVSTAEIIIDVFLEFMDSEGYDDMDQINVLDGIKNEFRNYPYIFNQLEYESTAIKVNNGY